jgi:hypothetical protein
VVLFFSLNDPYSSIYKKYLHMPQSFNWPPSPFLLEKGEHNRFNRKLVEEN